jgi:hypothetical protein
MDQQTSAAWYQINPLSKSPTQPRFQETVTSCWSQAFSYPDSYHMVSLGPECHFPMVYSSTHLLVLFPFSQDQLSSNSIIFNHGIKQHRHRNSIQQRPSQPSKQLIRRLSLRKQLQCQSNRQRIQGISKQWNAYHPPPQRPLLLPLDYGGNSLTHANTSSSARLPLRRLPATRPLPPPKRNGIANPAPLGLLSFAFTTFLFSIIN